MNLREFGANLSRGSGFYRIPLQWPRARAQISLAEVKENDDDKFEVFESNCINSDRG